jgi:pyruvate/2-oxoglutarate dehydrogenase complex dihydrolipoamide dehydrogenase (E3) component
MLAKHGVDVRLNTRADVAALENFDEVVLATGVVPRMPDIPGVDHPMVLSYADARAHRSATASRWWGRVASGSTSASSWSPRRRA